MQGDTGGYGDMQGDTGGYGPTPAPADPLESARQAMMSALRQVCSAQITSRTTGYDALALEHEHTLWLVLADRAQTYRAALDQRLA